jgi:quinol monooxygenase YgiN
MMHAVIRKYTAGPEVAEEMRSKVSHLEQTMRQTPGFVAYYFLETDDGIATITITEDETGTQESMDRAATWVQQNLSQSGGSMSAPDVTTGRALISATR